MEERFSQLFTQLKQLEKGRLAETNRETRDKETKLIE